MKRIAKELLVLAKELLVEATITFNRVPDVDNSIYSAIHSEMQRMADRIRKNEGIEVITTRKDTDDAMEIGVGFSDHEAKDAILEEFGKLGSKLAKRNGVGDIKMDKG